MTFALALLLLAGCSPAPVPTPAIAIRTLRTERVVYQRAQSRIAACGAKVRQVDDMETVLDDRAVLLVVASDDARFACVLNAIETVEQLLAGRAEDR